MSLQKMVCCFFDAFVSGFRYLSEYYRPFPLVILPLTNPAAMIIQAISVPGGNVPRCTRFPEARPPPLPVKETLGNMIRTVSMLFTDAGGLLVLYL
jgi:hypothetical protein